MTGEEKKQLLACIQGLESNYITVQRRITDFRNGPLMNINSYALDMRELIGQPRTTKEQVLISEAHRLVPDRSANLIENALEEASAEALG